MQTYLIVLAVLAILSLVYLKIAIKFKIIDKPNERSSHTKITVRGGGIIFPIAIFIFFLLNNYQYPYFTLGVFLISFVSFLDDIYTLSSKIRFPFQFIAIALILFELNVFSLPAYFIILYLITGIGFINMFNFMDGINGITGIYSLSVLAGFLLINTNENIINNDLIIFSILSLLVFGVYNFRKKALFFAGDIGSIAIGMLIFFIGLLFTIKLNSPLILLLVIVYGADAGCTLLYRKFYTNESVLDPHRHHIYQKIVDDYRFSHLKVSSVYGVLQLLVNIIVFKSYNLNILSQLVVFIVLVAIFLIIYISVFKIIKNKRSIK